jgi:HK97 family phage major capsid protein
MTVEEILAALAEIIEKAQGEERPLTEEEVTAYEKLEKDLQACQRTEAVAKRHAAYNAIERNDAGLHKAPKKDDGYEKAFEAYMRTGRPNSDLETFSNAQSEGTGSEGGYLVPTTLRDKIVDRMKAFGGIANVVDTLTTSSGENVNWPTVDDTANVGEIVQEGGTFSGGADLVFGEASLGAYSYMAGGGSATPLRVSLELLQDAAFDIQGLVSRKLGERIARIQAVHLVSGNGAGQPLGISYGLTGVEIAADTAGITYDDLVTFIHSVDPAYRENGCRWAFNDTTLATIKKIKDSHGDPIWRPASADMATETGGGTLMGYPVTIDQAFPNVDVDANDVNWGVFGNLQEGYVVRRVRDVQLLVNPYSRMANRQVEFTAWARMDATQQNTNAYVALTGEEA